MSKAILLTLPLGLLKVVTSRGMGVGLVSTPYLPLTGVVMWLNAPGSVSS